jgi:hypothetical protein
MTVHDNDQDRRSRSGFPLSTLFVVFFLAFAILSLAGNAAKPSNWVYAGACLGFAFTCHAKPERLIAEGGRFETIHLTLRRGIRPAVFNTVAALTLVLLIGGLVLQFGFGM